MIRVFVADDQVLVRQGLRALLNLEPEIELAGEAGDGAEAIERIPPARADVVLLDVRMPHKSGIEVLRALQAAGTLPPTLVLTTFDDADAVLEAIRAGARGFLLKDIAFDQLIGAIRSVAAGATVFQPAITHRLTERARDRRASTVTDIEPLTSRELEVVRLMAGGYSNSEIAHALRTADGTVKNHVSNILAKLGARDRTRAVLKALEAGFLTD
ncbi:MAG TPA: response regulator transcription factor [Thermoanaerobaculia bacterium]|nr:response regulator transcription factor [Thermoanaerobaculia bacterium]